MARPSTDATTRCWRGIALAVALVLAILPACSQGDDGRAAAVPAPDATGGALGPVGSGAAPGSTLDPVAAASAAFAPTTLLAAPGLRTPPTACPAGAAGSGTGAGIASTPAAMAPPSTAPAGSSSTTTTIPTPSSALADLLADPRVAGDTISVSVAADGLGEIVSANPDTRLRPASNQKLVTAMAALALLGADERFATHAVATGPVVDGVLHGDLVLVGGGDPNLLHAGSEDSLDALAGQIQAAGITGVDGRLLVDESRYDSVRMGTGWPGDWNANVGPMSALVVDRNLYRHDADFVADPAIGNGEVLRAALAFRGIAVSGTTEHTSGTEGVAVGTVRSPTLNELVQVMLLRSDNLYAELLVKELGHRATGTPGTTADGLVVVGRFLRSLCVGVTSTDVDGSGLSYENYRSAREFRSLLQAARGTTWGSLLYADLPVAGQMGSFPTLADTPASGRVRAKGGSLAITKSMSGYATTMTGRQLTFSVIVNGGSTVEAEKAIHEFVARLVQLRV